jgi:hypothetical protein
MNLPTHAVVEWRWVSSRTRTHLAPVYRCTDPANCRWHAERGWGWHRVVVGYQRTRTRCGVGPSVDTPLYFANAPNGLRSPICELCWRDVMGPLAAGRAWPRRAAR